MDKVNGLVHILDILLMSLSRTFNLGMGGISVRTDRMRELRKALGLRQKDIADRVGVARNTYANYELGKHSPDRSVLSRIAKELGTTIEDLMGDAPTGLDTREVSGDESARGVSNEERYLALAESLAAVLEGRTRVEEIDAQARRAQAEANRIAQENIAEALRRGRYVPVMKGGVDKELAAGTSRRDAGAAASGGK